MQKNQDKIPPSDSPGRSYLPVIVLFGLILLAGIVFLIFSPPKPPGSPGSPLPSPKTPPARSAGQRPPGFSPPSSLTTTPVQYARVVTDSRIVESYVEPDPILHLLELAFQAGRCDELLKLVGPSAQEEGPRRFYASLIYSSGVRYWELKDYQKAANYMRCLMSNYQDYRDEALLVLTESEIALGDKTQARKHLQELKTNFPNRKEEIIKLEQKLTLGQ